MIAAEIILIVFVSLTASLGNALLKVGASASGEGELLEIHHLPRVILRPAVLAGGAVYAVSQLLWITVLRVVDLSLAYPIQIGLNFVLIMLVAWFYFREPVARGKLAGIALIFAGIVLSATA